MLELVPQDRFDKLPEAYRLRARQIAERVGTIDSLLLPSKPEAVGAAVVRLAKQFLPQPDVDTRDMASEFRAACRDLPEWAVSEATNDFLGGRVDSHSGKFMPICAEFAKRARSILLPLLAERASLRVEASKLVERAEDDRRRHLIEMERQRPAVRKRVADLTEAFIAGTAKSQARPHIGLSDDAMSRLAALKKPRQFQSKIGHSKQEG